MCKGLTKDKRITMGLLLPDLMLTLEAKKVKGI